MKRLSKLKTLLIRFFVSLLVLLILIVLLLVAAFRSKPLNEINGYHEMEECYSQNFSEDNERELVLAIARRFEPTIILDIEEPANPDETGLIFQVEKTIDGYRITYQILFTKDWGLKNIIFKNRIWYLARWASKLVGTFGGHVGDAESIVILVRDMGWNEAGERVLSIRQVQLKQHVGWHYYSALDPRLRCKKGVSPYVVSSLRTHAMYLSVAECNRSIGNDDLRFSTDTCSYGQELELEVLPDFDVGTPEDPKDPFTESEWLSKLFPGESLQYTTFCGGERESSTQKCKAFFNFDEIRNALISQESEAQ